MKNFCPRFYLCNNLPSSLLYIIQALRAKYSRLAEKKRREKEEKETKSKIWHVSRQAANTVSIWKCRRMNNILLVSIYPSRGSNIADEKFGSHWPIQTRRPFTSARARLVGVSVERHQMCLDRLGPGEGTEVSPYGKNPDALLIKDTFHLSKHAFICPELVGLKINFQTKTDISTVSARRTMSIFGV